MKMVNRKKSRFIPTLLASIMMSSIFVSTPASYGEEVLFPQMESDFNSVEYTLTSTTNTLFVDLKDMYAYQFAYVDVKKKVLVNGKLVLRYVNVDIVVLDEFARATIKTRIGIKVGDIIRVSMAENPDNLIVKWQHIK
jgi:hypothetical protein